MRYTLKKQTNKKQTRVCYFVLSVEKSILFNLLNILLFMENAGIQLHYRFIIFLINTELDSM